MYSHPDFSGLDYDIAILELADNLEYGEKVAAITLPSPSQSWPGGTEVLVSGWGVSDPDAPALSVNLQGVTVEIIDQDTCIKDQGITMRMLCAGVNGGGKDSCNADSGGPLQVDGILAGIVSFGSGECGSAIYPGVYANVSDLRGFITDVTGL